MENTAFIALGSNMGDRLGYLKKAIQLLDKHPGIKVVNISSIYETDPVGYEDQDLFLNMAIEIKTDIDPFALLDTCLSIEKVLGRKREIKWGPRTIDLDILLYNQENIESEKLTLPHPRMLERAFVAIPLLDLGEGIFLPDKEPTLRYYLNQIPDKEGVRIWKRINGEDVSELIES